MTRDNFAIFFWGATIILLTFAISLCGHEFTQSFALAVALLPAIIAMKYSLQNVSFDDKLEGARNLIFATTGSLLLGWLLIVITYYNFGFFQEADIEKPIASPLLIATFTIIPAIVAWRIDYYMESHHSYNDNITFVSDRRNITLDSSTIRFIESNDTEVYIHTSGDESYRTHTRISHWKALLDRRFVRVHRSYIVNINQIKSYDSQRITIADRTIEISRKYRDDVRSALEKWQQQQAKERA